MDKHNAIQRRDIRLPISAEIELTEESGRVLRARCSNISACGCYVETHNPFLLWTRLKLRVVYRGESFSAAGAVMHSSAEVGMGVEFSEMAEEQRAILTAWLAHLTKSLSGG